MLVVKIDANAPAAAFAMRHRRQLLQPIDDRAMLIRRQNLELTRDAKDAEDRRVCVALAVRLARLAEERRQIDGEPRVAHPTRKPRHFRRNAWNLVDDDHARAAAGDVHLPLQPIELNVATLEVLELVPGFDNALGHWLKPSSERPRPPP